MARCRAAWSPVFSSSLALAGRLVRSGERGGPDVPVAALPAGPEEAAAVRREGDVDRRAARHEPARAPLEARTPRRPLPPRRAPRVRPGEKTGGPCPLGGWPGSVSRRGFGGAVGRRHPGPRARRCTGSRRRATRGRATRRRSGRPSGDQAGAEPNSEICRGVPPSAGTQPEAAAAHGVVGDVAAVGRPRGLHVVLAVAGDRRLARAGGERAQVDLQPARAVRREGERAAVRREGGEAVEAARGADERPVAARGCAEAMRTSRGRASSGGEKDERDRGDRARDAPGAPDGVVAGGADGRAPRGRRLRLSAVLPRDPHLGAEAVARAWARSRRNAPRARRRRAPCGAGRRPASGSSPTPPRRSRSPPAAPASPRDVHDAGRGSREAPGPWARGERAARRGSAERPRGRGRRRRSGSRISLLRNDVPRPSEVQRREEPREVRHDSLRARADLGRVRWIQSLALLFGGPGLAAAAPDDEVVPFREAWGWAVVRARQRGRLGSPRVPARHRHDVHDPGAGARGRGRGRSRSRARVSSRRRGGVPPASGAWTSPSAARGSRRSRS